MSSDWPVLPLEQCLEALIDYRGKTPEKTEFGVPLVTAKVIKGGRIEKPTELKGPPSSLPPKRTSRGCGAASRGLAMSYSQPRRLWVKWHSLGTSASR